MRIRRLRGYLVRLICLFRREQRDLELAEELESHLQMHTEDNLRSGMTPEEARRQALIKLGGVEQAKEEYRSQRGLPAIETLVNDLSYGFRRLIRSPGFTAVAVLSLALGIGANTAIFTIVNAVLLRPLPYTDADKLVRIGGANLSKGRMMSSFSPQDFYDWQAGNNVFESLSACDKWSLNLTDAGEPERLDALAVSANFFQVLRAEAALGRTFLSAEDQLSATPVAILSHALWQRRFNSDPNIVGRQIILTDEAYTVIGVMPEGFRSPPLREGQLTDPELWVPFTIDLKEWTRSSRSVDAAVGRLKPGVTIEQARSEMQTIASRLERQYPESNTNQSISVDSLQESIVQKSRMPLLIVLGAVGFLLLIACANVAGLLLARSTERQREIAIRMALGATRSRIIRQLLAESLMLSLLGGALGLLLALWSTNLLVVLAADLIPRVNHIETDGRVLVFTLFISFATGIAFGLAPAFHLSIPNLNETLKEGGRGGSMGLRSQRLRSILVISEIALSLLLLVGAGLLARSFLRLQEVNPGFRPENLLTMYISLPGNRYMEDEQKVAFFNRVVTGVRSLPGVGQASVVSILPISENFDRFGIVVEGQPAQPLGVSPEADRYRIGPDYFSTMSIPLIAGRVFNERDRAQSSPVVIINETLARRYWPGESAVGKRIKGARTEDPWLEVVGVVVDVKQYGLDTAPTLQVYLPQDQSPTLHMTLVVRTGPNPGSYFKAVREKIWEIDRSQPVYNIRTMEQLLSNSVTQRRFSMTLLGLISTMALILSCVGLYGVISYTVTQRAHEIGIRIALGARSWDVLKMVLGQGAALTITGICIGLVSSYAMTKMLNKLLFEVAATDSLTYLSVSLLILLVSLLSCFLPARRAMKVDPMVALRHE